MSSKLQNVLDIHNPKPRFKVISVISKRFSPRWYSQELIDPADLDVIFEAARLAPSAYNAQPWHFYFVDKHSSKYKEIFHALSENNQRWAKSAPGLVIAAYDAEDAHGPNRFAIYDLGAAVISFILQATELGYYWRQMGNVDDKKLGEILNLKSTEIPYVVIAIGKLGDYQEVDEKTWELELTARPRKEKIFEIIK